MKAVIVKRTTTEIALITVPSVSGCPEAEEVMKKEALEKAESQYTEWQHSISTYEIIQEVKP